MWYQNLTPPEGGRSLDIDDTSGLGPETYTMTLPVTGTYNVEVNYYADHGEEGGQSFRIRWVVWEGTDREVRDSRSGSLGEPGATRSFTIQVR